MTESAPAPMHMQMQPVPPQLPVRGPHLKIALCLGAAAFIATLLLFPYLLALMPRKFATLPLPWWLLMPAQALQAGVLCWLLGWLGLRLGARHALDAPWLRALIYRRPRPATRRAHWPLAILLGALAALAVTGLETLFAHHSGSPARTAAVATSINWAWRGALASFYGGVVEEVECRLLLVSALVWLLAWFNHQHAQAWMYLTAIVLAALLFGAGHLPAAFAAGMAATPLFVARIVLLNAIAGVVFGCVYWRWGLEHAMLAHFSADLVLHVLVPLASTIV